MAVGPPLGHTWARVTRSPSACRELLRGDPADLAELWSAIPRARAAVEERYSPAGFTITISIGVTAGQTIPHLSVELIPRYVADTAPVVGAAAGSDQQTSLAPGHQPQGARALAGSAARDAIDGIDGAAADNGPRLVRGSDDPLLPYLITHLAQAQQADLAVSFVLESGVQHLEPYLIDLVDRGGALRLVTSDYLDVTEPSALLRLLDIQATAAPCAVELHVFEARRTGFHPKAYLFTRLDGSAVAFVGSSNVSESALLRGVEWNYQVVSSHDAAGFATIRAAFDALLRHPDTRPLDQQWIDTYRPAARAHATRRAGACRRPRAPTARGHDAARRTTPRPARAPCGPA